MLFTKYIHEVKNNADRLDVIANQHIAAVRGGNSSLIVAPTHAKCRAISEVVRDRQKKEGFLSGKGMQSGDSRR